MVKKQFENELLKQKKARFLATVNKTARALGLTIPDVYFGDCLYREDEEAHIHPEERLICVSDDKLKRMTYEDIDETASHEVNHLLDTRDESNPNHSAEFYIRHDQLKVATWKPPTGVTHYDGRKPKLNLKIKLKKINPNECSFHSCKVKEEMSKCPSCERKYCKIHVGPFEPGDEIHIKLNPNSGHACGHYFEYMQKKKKEEDKKYQESLTYVFDSSSRNKSKSKQKVTEINLKDHYNFEEKHSKKQEFNIVDKPKDYKEPQPVYIESKDSIFERIKNKIKSLFKE